MAGLGLRLSVGELRMFASDFVQASLRPLQFFLQSTDFSLPGRKLVKVFDGLQERPLVVFDQLLRSRLKLLRRLCQIIAFIQGRGHAHTRTELRVIFVGMVEGSAGVNCDCRYFHLMVLLVEVFGFRKIVFAFAAAG